MNCHDWRRQLMLDIHDPNVIELKKAVAGYARALQELAQAQATLGYWAEDVLRAQKRLLKAEASLKQSPDDAMANPELYTQASTGRRRQISKTTVLHK
jgi:hypothetical protein